jgi:hypothetical protein
VLCPRVLVKPGFTSPEQATVVPALENRVLERCTALSRVVQAVTAPVVAASEAHTSFSDSAYVERLRFTVPAADRNVSLCIGQICGIVFILHSVPSHSAVT